MSPHIVNTAGWICLPEEYGGSFTVTMEDKAERRTQHNGLRASSRKRIPLIIFVSFFPSFFLFSNHHFLRCFGLVLLFKGKLSHFPGATWCSMGALVKTRVAPEQTLRWRYHATARYLQRLCRKDRWDGHANPPTPGSAMSVMKRA